MAQQSENNNPLKDKFNEFEFTPSNNFFDGIQDAINNDPEQGGLSHVFSNFEKNVDDEVWNSIEKELHPKKKRRGIIWWGAAACIAIALGVNFMDSNSEMLNPIASSETSEEIEIDSKNSQLVFTGNQVEKSAKEYEPTSSGGEKKEIVATLVEAREVKKNYTAKSIRTIKVVDQPQYQIINIETKRIKLNDNYNEQLEKQNFQNLAAELFDGLEREEKKHKKKKHKINPYSGSLFASGTSFASNEMAESVAAEEDLSFTEGIPIVDATGVILVMSTEELPMDVPSSVVEYISDNEIEVGGEYKDYNSPITFGVLYERQIKDGLSISSGLNFTKVGFRYSEGFWSNHDRKGTESFLGIPLYLSYDFVKNSKLDLYPVLGAQVDFGIATKESVNKEGLTVDVELKKHSLGRHVSLIGGAGVAYGLTDNLSLYGQSVYQRNVFNKADNFLSQNPSNLNIQAGLKFSF